MGMGHIMHEDTGASLRWIYHPKESSARILSAKHAWVLVDDFVKDFNNHSLTNFNPVSKIYADESMIWLYSHRRDWINYGFLHCALIAH